MKIENLNKKVLVALSGGVDSSVAALILKKQGYDVIGAYMKLTRCHDEKSIKNAKAVCAKLGIPFHVFDVTGDFQKNVIDYFTKTYESGQTPNPCVTCNKTIKFGWLLEKARSLGCDYIATGHYARIFNCSGITKKDVRSLRGSQASGKRLRPTFFAIPENIKFNSNIECRVSSDQFILKAKDSKKDQTYFLWQLDQKQLKHILLPIGDMTKDEVRKMAKENKLPTYNTSESQDICFIPDGDINHFLSDNSKQDTHKRGNIVDTKGNILGQHIGLIYYNIGKRQSLPQLDLRKHYKKFNPQKLPALYVVKLDTKRNELVVGTKEDLYTNIVYAKKENWIVPELIMFPLRCYAKIRYGKSSENCIVYKENNGLKIDFSNPQLAVTPGQSIVFYDKEILLGGAEIIK